jgi:DNA-binding transcriptional MocR family regulator
MDIGHVEWYILLICWNSYRLRTMSQVQIARQPTAHRAEVTAATPRKPLYLAIAETLERQIRSGVLRVGDKVSSIRALRQQLGVSAGTALQAYFWLENRGCIEARPRSGFYVRVPFADLSPEPTYEQIKPVPKGVGLTRVISEILQAVANPHHIVALAAASPAAELLPNWKLNKLLAGVVRNLPLHSASYSFPPGVEELRRQIARRSLQLGCNFSPRDIVVTCGAMEALNLALRAVVKSGEVVAVESPTFFSILQMIESLGMKAVEIPTHPRTGMDLNILEHSIRKHRVGACIAMTNCHNPLGYILSDDLKKQLVELVSKYDVALIEDDVYGDLAFQDRRPRTAKGYDRKGLVLLCSSFSKVLAPGYRIGWLHAGSYRTTVEQLKFINTVASPSLQQIVVAKFLESGGYERHVRRLRRTFAEQLHMFSRAIAKYFPEGTRVSRPAGGFVLWIELPPRVDAVKLYRNALRENISVLPGPIFSATSRFTNCIRLSCAAEWSETLDRALLALGRLCQKN